MNRHLQKLYDVENEYVNILHLTPNENQLSDMAQRFFSSSVLNNRYNMGKGIDGVITQGGSFAAKAMPEFDELITEAEIKANAMLNASVTTLNCLSGVHAMMSTILSTTLVGDTVMTVPSNQGGHFCTSKILKITGRENISTEYDFERLTFDVDRLADKFKKSGASALYLDTSVLVNPHPIAQIRNAIGDNAIIIFDASHTLGLIMAGEFQAPLLEGADVISANTHKTFPGPHKGLIAFRNREFGQKAESIIRGSFYSTVHTTNLLALAITVIEFYEFGKEYVKQMLKNANHLGQCLVDRGCKVRRADYSTYTKTHQVHLFVERDRKELVKSFLDNNMSVNTSRALGKDLFLRIGVQEITRRGMKEQEIEIIADFIVDTLNGKNVRNQVMEFNRLYQKIYFGYSL